MCDHFCCELLGVFVSFQHSSLALYLSPSKFKINDFQHSGELRKALFTVCFIIAMCLFLKLETFDAKRGVVGAVGSVAKMVVLGMVGNLMVGSPGMHDRR